MSDAATPGKSFEENLAELEAVVRELDDGKTSLETAIARYEQGIGLLKACTAMLHDAEQKILLLTGTDEQGAAQIQPFEHSSAVATDRPVTKSASRPKTATIPTFLSKAEHRSLGIAKFAKGIIMVVLTPEGLDRVSPDFDDLFRSLQARVDAYLPEALAFAGGPPRLREAMTYSVMAPGKRLRPILVMLATSAAGGSRDAALPAAAAVELVHTYSLIHDDLPAMDDDDLRRGRPTCHKEFDEALAILAGDALLTLAFQIVAERYPAATAGCCVRELARGAGAAGMVGGQVEDLEWENEPSGSAGDLERIHANKTGALFGASLRMGAFVAQGERAGGPDTETLDRLDRFGSAFGLAFQITDDLLDVQGATGHIGKRVGKDATRGKLTYPGLLGIDESRRRATVSVAEAVAAVRPFGKAGEPLAALAGYLIDRDR